MATMKLTNQEQVEDFVRGCTLYATGGGGLPENGIVSLMSEIEKNGSVGWTDVAEIPDDVLAVCPFLMGSIAPHDEYTIKEMEGFGYTEGVNKEKERLAKAIQELEDYTGKKLGVVVPIELAGANTSGPVSAGSSLGMLAVDGDYCGRAIPGILQITPYLNGKECLPVTSVDEWGNTCIIKDAVNLRVVEKIGKLISAGGYGLAGQAGFVMTGKELKETVIPGTLTKAYEVGRFIREAREAGETQMVKKLASYKTLTGRKKAAKANPKIAALQVELAHVDSEIEKLVDSLTGANNVLLSYVNVKIAELDGRKQELLARIAELTVEAISPEQVSQISGYLDTWENVSFDDKRRVVDLMITTIAATSDSLNITWKI